MNRLAIIIPYYKLNYFKHTLDSLCLQTDKRFSIYIGDDCSPQDPKSLLRAYEGQLTFVYKKFQNNLGGNHLTKQWDRCVELSEKEDWLMILGDDDTISENYVEAFYENLKIAEEKSIEVIRFASKLINEEGSDISQLFINPELELAAKSYMRTFKGDGRSTLTEHIFSRRTYEKNGFKEFPVAFGSDNVAWLEFPEMGEILSINNAFASIRISREHLSSKGDEKLNLRRKQGIYLFNRYIISNYSKYFTIDDQFLILKKAYKNLRTSDRSILKAVDFCILIIRKMGFSKTLQIIKVNKY
ncbi:glycosyltransferase family A protein [Epilithonimonas ginsengisoli]|uniref:Glycosyltransferase family A protein n=1 Tax=Epilithonimonas ginsengisoli TaxID=1245592 RepID=A0ABU4JJU0_9FLAO|nr:MULTISPECIES: glycosyltransferase family A protein [Chryseobacterium group]MBV6880923.1 glycosyltransferase family 2 protein [Epilithonimonas sp. FP105]MDW8549813.1 glycosyltransferase family A protein [Epilithonimonas ginsengisoli]